MKYLSKTLFRLWLWWKHTFWKGFPFIEKTVARSGGGFLLSQKHSDFFKQQIQNVPTKQFEEHELLSLTLYGFRGNMKLQKQQNQQHIQHLNTPSTILTCIGDDNTSDFQWISKLPMNFIQLATVKNMLKIFEFIILLNEFILGVAKCAAPSAVF
jgi:hypothetical protein